MNKVQFCTYTYKFSKILFQLKDNCFTTLYWFLPYIDMNQPQVDICPLPLEPPSHPIPPLQIITVLWFEFPESYTKFPLAIYSSYGSVCVFPCYSFHSSHPLLPLTCIHVSSMSASPLLPCKQVHQSHLSRFHIYGLIYDICFYLSDLLHSV